MSEIQIGEHSVGSGLPMFVIAELSANHLGDLGRALELVSAAAEAGADAVKTQAYSADSITLRSDRPEFLIGPGSPWAGRRLWDLYAEAATPWDWHGPIRDAAHAQGMAFISSPFSPDAVDALVELGADAIKIASFEIVDTPLISHAAATLKPLIISTGMATAEEIDEAVAAADSNLDRTALLRCVSSYPADPKTMNLSAIPDMAQRWNVPVGFSDHSIGSVAALVARTLGACMLEKHITLKRSDGGPDAAFSSEPHEFRELVDGIRMAEASFGTATYGPNPDEVHSLAHRRSLYWVVDREEGDQVRPGDVRSVRPASGLPPRELSKVIGSRLARTVRAQDPVRTEDFADLR